LLLLAPLSAARDLAGFNNHTDASVYIVHGIPGEDLGLDHDLPVDLAVNGTCIVRGLPFGQIHGPHMFTPDVHQFNFSLADSFSPCANSGDPVAVLEVDFSDGGHRSVVAHLDASGDPDATAFYNDLTTLLPTESRAILHHTAAAPMIDITLRTDLPNAPGLGCVQATNGDQCTGELLWGVWGLLIGPPSIQEILYGPQMVMLPPWKANLFYVVGSLDNDTLTVLHKEVLVRRKIGPYWRRLLGDDGRVGSSPGKIRPGS
jgi:hypothetical protein